VLQPLEGASGTLTRRTTTCPHRTLQPLEGASGTRDHHLHPVRTWCFNPSKVRLEPPEGDHLRGHDGRFNPSKVRLELARGPAVAHRVRASTPRRCVWNALASVSVAMDSGLQPLEGASGTQDCSRYSSRRGQLQPLEGASGTVHLVLQPLGHVASTPRRCVWNQYLVVLPQHAPHASTPRRCVWNLGGFTSVRVVDGASTPRRCVWNTARPTTR